MTFKLKGGPELLGFLDQFPAKLQTSVLRAGMLRGANVIRDEARALVSVKSGLTRKSIKTQTGARGGIITATVTMKGPHAYLGIMIEYGIAPHLITAAGMDSKAVKRLNKRVKRESLAINGAFVGPAVHHPGVAAHPFMRTALDTKAQEAVNAVGQFIAAKMKIGSLQAPLLEVDE